MHGRYRIRNGDGIADMLQQRQIRNVVTDVGAYRLAYAKRHSDLVEGGDLVSASLDDVRNAEFSHAARNGRGAAAADDSNLNAGSQELPDAIAILRMKRFASMPSSER